MSVKIMAMVYECGLKRDEKTILLAYADHADHEGNNIYPSVGLIAWKTGYDERSVQLITKKLIRQKVLVRVGSSDMGTNEYYIAVDALPKRESYRRSRAGRPVKTGEEISPVLPDEDKRGEISDTESEEISGRGEIHAKKGENSGTNHAENFTRTVPNHQLNPSVNQNNPSNFSSSSFSPDVEGQLGKPDLMQPVGMVPQSEPPADPAPDLPPGPTAEHAWECMLYEMQSSSMVSKAVKDNFINEIKPVSLNDGHFVVSVPNEYAKMWFEERMKKWALRQLKGICNLWDVSISVITPEAEGAGS